MSAAGRLACLGGEAAYGCGQNRGAEYVPFPSDDVGVIPCVDMMA